MVSNQGDYCIHTLYYRSFSVLFSFILFGRRRTKEGCLSEVSLRFEEDICGQHAYLQPGSQRVFCDFEMVSGFISSCVIAHFILTLI